MKEQDAAEAAMLLEGLAKIREEIGEIKEKWMGSPKITPDEIWLPPAVWLDVLGYAGMMAKVRLRELGVTIETAPG